MGLANMAERLGLDEEDCAEILSLFVETTLCDLDTLSRAVAGEDVLTAVQAAHSIKGAAANLGLDEVSSYAGTVEMNARKGILKGAMEAVDAIRGRVDLMKVETY